MELCTEGQILSSLVNRKLIKLHGQVKYHVFICYNLPVTRMMLII